MKFEKKILHLKYIFYFCINEIFSKIKRRNQIIFLILIFEYLIKQKKIKIDNILFNKGAKNFEKLKESRLFF